jgi:hypothetical protein
MVYSRVLVKDAKVNPLPVVVVGGEVVVGEVRILLYPLLGLDFGGILLFELVR